VTVPLSQQIRGDVERRIVSGDWPPGHRIPFEHELVRQYGCSRMTVNKALSALAAAGLIVRRRRAGSFVAQPRTERALMAIEDFAEAAARTGAEYRHQILFRRLAALGVAEARALGLPRGEPVRRIGCLHRFDGVPVAAERRLIVLRAVPAARTEPFTALPPGGWLLRNVPWTEAEHVIRARNADAGAAALLDVAAGTACLVLERRTWHLGAVVTSVEITYPGERHRFVGRFSPTA
jgi:GntR family transcriptional regulator, histidine utilization repressor